MPRKIINREVIVFPNGEAMPQTLTLTLHAPTHCAPVVRMTCEVSVLAVPQTRDGSAEDLVMSAAIRAIRKQLEALERILPDAQY
jgi:hypothetical protein